MHFQQFYLTCLAHASYLIASEGEAVVVDPQRDVQQYIDEAKGRGATIRYIIETHLHADFVSGHRELAEKTGAEIVFGWRAAAELPHREVRDGEELRIGKVILRALETPGHTPESVSWLIIDTEVSNHPQKVLTGDTLFIGDVGRPDLVGSKGFSAEQMAAMLYDSLHRKLMTLPDEVEVYPAHGAGSACGRNISKERSSTIGEQRKFNYALRPMSREEFVKIMTTDLAAAPSYFGMDAEINRRGARPLEEIVLTPLDVAQMKEQIERGALVLDVRDSAGFGTGHIHDSINIGLRGQYASWSGSLLRAEQPIVLVAESKEAAAEATMRLARVGFENVAGYLDGGIVAWSDAGLPVEQTTQISVDELDAQMRERAALLVLDVRNRGEYENGHVPQAINIPLAQLEKELAQFDAQRPTAIICQSGYRSSAASSLLQRRGFVEVSNVVGGTNAWIAAGLTTER